MLERCVHLDAAYVPAYLLLARLYQGQEGRGSAVGRLLRHVAHLQPNSPDHLAELAAWLHQQGEGHILHICIARVPFHTVLSASNLHLRFSIIVVVTK
jgi:hypothetical protein